MFYQIKIPEACKTIALLITRWNKFQEKVVLNIL